MGSDIERIKQTVRDLLNLANNSGAMEGEINNAVRFAAKLMDEHQLTEEDLEQKGKDDILLDLEKKAMGEHEVSLTGMRDSNWERMAGSFVCSLVGGVSYYITSGPRRNPVTGGKVLDENGYVPYSPAYTFYGIDEDAALAKEIFGELIVTIAAMAKLKWGGVYRGPGRDYCEGFVQGMERKLHTERAKAHLKLEFNPNTGKTESTGTSLVVVARKEIVERKRELTEQYKKEKLRLSRGRSLGVNTRSYSHEARKDGISDGHKHDANRERRKKLT